MLSMRLIVVAAGVLLMLDIVEVKAEDSTEEITEEKPKPLPKQISKYSKDLFEQAKREINEIISDVTFFKLFGEEFREEVITKLQGVNRNIDLMFSGKAKDWVKTLMESIDWIISIFFAGEECRRSLECSLASVSYRLAMHRLLEAILQAFDGHDWMRFKIRESCEYFLQDQTIDYQTHVEAAYECLWDVLLVLEKVVQEVFGAIEKSKIRVVFESEFRRGSSASQAVRNRNEKQLSKAIKMLSMRLFAVVACVLLMSGVAEVKAEDFSEEITEVEAKELPKQVNPYSKPTFQQVKKANEEVVWRFNSYKLFEEDTREEYIEKLQSVNKYIDTLVSGEAKDWIEGLKDAIGLEISIFFGGPDCRGNPCGLARVWYRIALGHLMEATVEAFDGHDTMKFRIRATCEYFNDDGTIDYFADEYQVYLCLISALVELEKATEA